VACEFTGVVREAFRARGHEAVSCDLEASEIPGPHYIGDVRDILDKGFDMMIAFPPCTYLSAAGSRWWSERPEQQDEALEFVRTLMDAPIPRIAIENPKGIIGTRIRKPDQTIQPWQYGHGETKMTCLWLKALPLLRPTNVVEGREQRMTKMSNSVTRSRDRSRTYPGIAEAMAEQWGAVTPQWTGLDS
jgi:site-specific DNA-cytosine methylase